jgi:hypothetical protein
MVVGPSGVWRVKRISLGGRQELGRTYATKLWPMPKVWLRPLTLETFKMLFEL